MKKSANVVNSYKKEFGLWSPIKRDTVPETLLKGSMCARVVMSKTSSKSPLIKSK